MEDRKTTVSRREGQGPDRLVFNGFSFPILPSMEYATDGPDKQRPDRLFVRDRQGRFMFYFEAGMEAARAMEDMEDYQRVEVNHSGRKLELWYPEQRTDRVRAMGYFTLRFAADAAAECCGQLMISQPAVYFTGLLEIPELYTLLAGIEIAPAAEAPS